MKQFILKGGLALLLMIVSAGQALAVDISAPHQILSVQPSANGNNITINITLSNNSAGNVDFVAVSTGDPAWQVNADASAKVGLIGAGLSASHVLQINTGLQNFDGLMPLNIHVFYIDSSANPVDVDITSVVR